MAHRLFGGKHVYSVSILDSTRFTIPSYRMIISPSSMNTLSRFLSAYDSLSCLTEWSPRQRKSKTGYRLFRGKFAYSVS